MKTKNKTAYFEWLRIFASAAVVLMHTAAAVLNQLSVDAAPWQIVTIYDALVRWPVPLFVMITGAIFLPRKTSLKTVLLRYIPRMILCYLIWAWLFARYARSQGATPETFWHNIATGQYHLWYLPFLCGVYLTFPFLQKIAEDRKLTGQLLAVSLTVGSLIPWLADLAALLRPDWEPVLSALKNHLNFSFFFDLLFVVVLGHVLNRREFTVLQRWLLYLAGLASLVLTIMGTLQLSARAAKPISLFFSHSSPLNLCTAAAIFVFARYNLTRLPRFVEGLAACSFGIYLSHALLLVHLQDQNIHPLRWDPVWAVPVMAAAVFAVCALGTALFRKIPVVGKYLT